MSKFPFLPVLQQARDCGNLCSIYCNAERPRRAVQGFVDFLAHDSFLVRGVDDHGFLWRLLEDVYRVETEGEYEQKIAYLFQSRSQNHPPLLPTLDVASDLRREVLEAAKRHGLLVRVEILRDDCRDDWVKEVAAEILSLQLVNAFGHKDGQCVVDLETIEKIDCDTLDLQDSKLLTRWNEIPPSTK